MEKLNNDPNKPENEQPERVINIPYLKKFLSDMLDLRQGVDKMATIKEINDRKSMAGANAWMLMCSIIIASIGLDRDSDAVIIGAMLISPLMSPILGVGLGIGVNDKETLQKSFFNFWVSVFIALLTSTIYFFLTPFGEMTPSIFSRTEPNTLDVLVAIFGGIAGIISIARKDISTTLPGVAIATALMPPICVTGYGIANGNFQIALSSFYLFTMNSCFIAISTYLIVRYLRFPYKKYLIPNERIRNRWIVFIIALAVIIPSFLTLNGVLKKERTVAIIENFIEEDLGDKKIYLDDYIIMESDTSNLLILKTYGNQIHKSIADSLELHMAEYGFTKWNVQIIQSSEVDLARLQQIEKSINDVRAMAHQEILEEQKEIEKFEKLLLLDSLNYEEVVEESEFLFDNIDIISYGKMNSIQGDSVVRLPTFIIKTRADNSELVKLNTFLNKRMDKTVKVVITE